MRRQRVRCAALTLPLAVSAPALGGTLTGPILNDGTAAALEDVVQLPASSASRPLARVNVLREVPDGSGRLFACDLNGPLLVIGAGGVTVYMDFSLLFPALKTVPGLASGLVSFAFHPEFASNGLFYTVHSEYVGAVPPNLGPALPTSIVQHSVLTEWRADDPSADVFAGTSRELLRIAAPERHHNLGEIAFDPDAQPGDPDYGLLYLGAGDYGSVFVGEPEQLQRLDAPYGAILRIDPLGGPFTRGGIAYDYSIPASNPFANDPEPSVLGEIYALGFRNAHRIAWDRGGASPGPYVSDVGQGNVEEVNRLVAGGNYGWPLREGSFALDVAVDPESVFALPPDDASFGFRYPLAQYDHEEGSAIAGGFVLRGGEAGALAGRFVFGDIVSGRIFYADAAALLAADDGDPASTAPVYELNLLRDGQPVTLAQVVAAALGLASLPRVDLRFGTDAAGRLYVTTKQDGFVRRLLPVPEPGAPALLVAGVSVCAALARLREQRTHIADPRAARSPRAVGGPCAPLVPHGKATHPPA